MGCAMEITFDRIRSAIRVLAADSGARRLQRLMWFVRVLMNEGAARPSTFARWLTGSLVIDFRWHEGATLLVMVSEQEDAFIDVFSCELTFIAYEEVRQLLEREPAVAGPGFVLTTDDQLSVCLLRQVEVDTGAEERSSRFESLFDADIDDTRVIARWDMEATIISAPSPALLDELGRGPQSVTAGHQA